MAKIKTYNGKIDYFDFMCPGCKRVHILSDKIHTWNQDYDKPTMSPSVLFDERNNKEGIRCHSYIVDGEIQFLQDCTHALVGQTVELPEIE